MVRLRRPCSIYPTFDTVTFRLLSFQDFGRGKAKPFADFFREEEMTAMSNPYQAWTVN